jgi:type IV secretion system protein VirD4
MFSLPRGASYGQHQAPLASADWEHPQAIERLAFAGGASLFLGAIPYSDAWPKLAELRVNLGKVLTRIETSALPPLERAAAVRKLDTIWHASQLADCLPLGIDDDRHFVTIAGARSGKGRSAIIPNLCVYPGSVVVLDPKGENASLTAARRGPGDKWCTGLGQDIYVLDPFGVASVPEGVRASLNPLALLDRASPLVVDDAALLAEGLIVPGEKEDAHWTETARNIVKGILLHLVSTKPGATLFDLRVALTTGDRTGFEAAQAKRKAAELALEDDPDLGTDLEAILPKTVRDAFSFLLHTMAQNQAFEGAVMGAAESLLGTGGNERGSTLSTARRNTAFLDTLGPRFKAALSGQVRPLDPDQLKEAPQGISVYLCLPSERMGTHGRWLRMLIALFLERMQRNLKRPACGAPVLFLLEEFFTLGTMAAIEKAAGYAAGFGVKLWAVLQDLQQLMSLYPTSWQTFLANAGALQVFGTSDKETLEYVSKALGEIEITRVTNSTSENSTEGVAEGAPLDRYGPALGVGMKNTQGGVWTALLRGAISNRSSSAGVSRSANSNEGLHIVPLLRPDEIAQQFSRESGAELLLVKGRKPVWCLRVDYDRSPWFAGLFTPLPGQEQDYREGQVPRDFWQRPPDPFREAEEAFRALIGSLSQAA